MSDSREAQRQRNRDRAPAIAQLMDEIREKFPEAKLVWGVDLTTGVEFGTKEEEKNVFTIPPNYYPTASLEELKAMREEQDKARGLRQQQKRRK